MKNHESAKRPRIPQEKMVVVPIPPFPRVFVGFIMWWLSPFVPSVFLVVPFVPRRNIELDRRKFHS
jgi:hypothetical protein